MTTRNTVLIINVVIWVPLVVLLAIGLFAPPIPNGSFGTTSGWLSAGLFSSGVVAAGLFSVGIYSAGLFSLGVFSVGLFSLGIFSFGTFALGIWAGGQFAAGRFLRRPKGPPAKE